MTDPNDPFAQSPGDPSPPPLYGPVAGLPPPPPPRRKFGVWGCLAVFGVLLFLFVLLMVIVSIFSRGDGRLVTEVIDSGDSRDTIAIITIDSVIRGSGSHAEGTGSVHSAASALRAAAADEDVKAVILQIDSPGGGLSASDIIYNEVKRLKDKGKKVVVCVGGLAASGGYYIAAPADWIICSPTGEVGSIGVIMPHFQVSELMGKIGVKVDTVKSAEMKDMGSIFRDMKPEERKFFEDTLAYYHEHFVGVVAGGRNLDKAAVRKLANGTVYTAEDALKKGLIDEVGYFDEALKKATELAGIAEKPRLVRYRKPFKLLDLMGASAQARSDAAEMRRLLEALSDRVSPRVDALWTGRLPE